MPVVWRGVAIGVLQADQVAAKGPPELAEPIKALIEAEPSFGYWTAAGLLDMNKNTV